MHTEPFGMEKASAFGSQVISMVLKGEISPSAQRPMLFLDSMALFPATKKYKEMAKEADLIEQAKLETKRAQKQDNNG